MSQKVYFDAQFVKKTLGHPNINFQGISLNIQGFIHNSFDFLQNSLIIHDSKIIDFDANLLSNMWRTQISIFNGFH